MTRPVVIIYGDCQVSYLVHLLRSAPNLSGLFDFHYISIIMPWQKNDIPAKPDLDSTLIARCSVFWKQIGPEDWTQPPDTYLQDIPSSAKVVKFPSVFFGAPWFRNMEDPLMRAEPPLHPTFPYQDPILAAVSDTSLDGREAYKDYERRVATGTGALARVLERELQIAAKRDAQCDVPMTAFIYSNFKRLRLFWNPTNPTNMLFAELTRRLLAATWPNEARIGGLLHDAADALGALPDPFHFQRHIISAPIANALQLEWWEPSHRYWTRVLDDELTAEEYVIKYVQHRRAQVRERAA